MSLYNCFVFWKIKSWDLRNHRDLTFVTLHFSKILKWILVPLELYMKKHFWISLPLGPSEPRRPHICHCASFQTSNESRKLWYLSLIYVTAYLSKLSKFETYIIYVIVHLPKQVRQFSGSHISHSVSLNK